MTSLEEDNLSHDEVLLDNYCGATVTTALLFHIMLDYTVL